jgi:hypothetical protein
MPMDEASERELICLREHFETKITANDARVQQALDTMREALSMARDGNNRRFDQMGEFRNAITDQVNRMISRQEFEFLRDSNNEKADEARRTIDARFDSELKPVNARLDQIGRPNWALMASIASIFLVMVGGFWVGIGLKIEAAVSPQTLDVAQLHTTVGIDSDRLRSLEMLTSNSTAADAQSRQDRIQLNERMRGLESVVSENSGFSRQQYAVLNARLVEIETQFCASDVVRNLLHAQDQRTAAMLWAKANPGEHIPTDNAYYPSICNRQPPSGAEK